MKYKKAKEMGKATKRAEFHAIYLSIIERSQMGQYDHTISGLLCPKTSDRLRGLGYEVNYLFGETAISWPEPAPF